MRVLVLGGGVAGVTTAWFLAREGADVTVVESRAGPGAGATLANGGHLHGSQARPWATPQAPWQALRWLGRSDAPLRLPMRLDPALWRWGARYLGNCTPGRYLANTRTLRRLACYSQQVLQDIAKDSGVAFGFRPRGTLAVFRHPRALAAAVSEARSLADDNGRAEEPLDPAACARLEPALAHAAGAGRIAGGILARDGATGDAHVFTSRLAGAATALGADFRYGTGVRALRTRGGRVEGAETSAGPLKADAVVLALGTGSRSIAQSVGLRLPIYPVKGYSVTFPAPSDGSLPTLGLADMGRRVVTSRLGAVFRVAGMVEFSGDNLRIDPRRAAAVLRALHELFPAASVPGLSQAQPWTGLRPMTPDGPPLLGPDRRAPGLYCNTGHGPLGWSLAAGSARMVADWIAGRETAIDPAGLEPARYA